MCDETTEAENEAYLAKTRSPQEPAGPLPASRELDRRQMGIGTGAALAALLTGCGAPARPSRAPDEAGSKSAGAPPPDAAATEPAQAMQENASPSATVDRAVTIPTPDGEAEAFFVAPKSGRHPGVLLWPDVAGLRDAYRQMATRLAGAGYAVLVMNPYYRATKLPLFTAFTEWQAPQGKARVRPMREALTPDAITRDAIAFVRWLDRRPEVAPERQLATIGYCMGGPFTFRTAAAAPERVGVLASFHGGGLVTEDAESPHALLERIDAAALICIAQNDDEREPEAKHELRTAAEKAGVPAEIEVYPAQHGWCTLDAPVYDEEQAERAWARMLATFERHL